MPRWLRCVLSRSRFAFLIWCLCTVLLLPGETPAQTAWTTSSDGAIERFDLQTGQVRGFAAFDINASALALGDDGRLFVVDVEVVDEPAADGFERILTLYAVDLSRRRLEPLGPLDGLDIVQDMAVDENGQLWLVSGAGILISVDPQTAGQQVIGGDGLESVAIVGGQLWGIQRQMNTWFLVTLNPATGDATEVGQLDGFEPPIETTALDVDTDGNLWVRRLDFPGIPMDPQTRYYRMQGADPSTLELVQDLGNVARIGFAMDRLVSPVEIPALGYGGQLLLVIILAGAAGKAIRRRE